MLFLLPIQPICKQSPRESSWAFPNGDCRVSIVLPEVAIGRLSRLGRRMNPACLTRTTALGERESVTTPLCPRALFVCVAARTVAGAILSVRARRRPPDDPDVAGSKPPSPCVRPMQPKGGRTNVHLGAQPLNTHPPTNRTSHTEGGPPHVHLGAQPLNTHHRPTAAVTPKEAHPMSIWEPNR